MGAFSRVAFVDSGTWAVFTSIERRFAVRIKLQDSEGLRRV